MDFTNILRNKKLILYIIVGIVVFFVLVFLGIIPGLKKDNNGEGGGDVAEINLKFWGVDPEEYYTDLIISYQSVHPDVKIEYKQVDLDDYEDKLVNALAGKKGPDVLMIKNNWVLKQADKLSPILPLRFSAKQLEESFPEVVVKDMVYQEKIYGIPLSIDTLALYYNKDIFNSAAISFPPTTWQEFQEVARNLTQKSLTSDLVVSGAALGTSKNIKNADDVLAALMIQSGSSISDGSGVVNFSDDQAKQALSFYTSFSNPASLYYSWSNLMPDSLEAFAQGKTAMMIDFASAQQKIEGKNQNLNYGIAPFPQSVKNASNLKNYSQYWSLSVSAVSSNQSAAWEFIFYLVNRDQAKQYLAKSNLPPSSRILIKEMINDEKLGLFAKQALSAKSWTQSQPEKNSQVFKNMIELVVSGRLGISEALSQAQDEINNLISD
jgi:multiple sugar transport system substrate-binding protein